MDLRRTALHATHRLAGARMADFGGWEMPIEYPTGVIAEHTAVRTAVGVFDVSHMGRLVVRGPGAVAALNGLLTRDLAAIGPGQAQYTMLLTKSGGVLDDLIAYVLAPDEVLLVPNAANADAVREALRSGLPDPIVLIDRQQADGIIAVQGPHSASLLAAMGLDCEALTYLGFATSSFEGSEVLVARTGYTGERGYELIAAADLLVPLWQRLTMQASPCGLGARDTLRTEMGYPLHGQDISPQITPVEAGLSWAVGWGKPKFPGRAALMEQRSAGRRRALLGLLATGRGVPRPGMAVTRATGEPAGITTSGTFSPTLRTGIALALLDPDTALGEEVSIDVRGRPLPATVVRPPFVDRSPR